MIKITEAPLPSEVSGFCARGRECDYIVADSRANELLRLHVLLHELYHLLSQHQPADGDGHQPMSDNLLGELLPGVKPGVVAKILNRSHYASPDERDAEVFATLMLQRLHLSTDQTSNGMLTSAFTHRRSGV
ncbi:hypothetical protein [Streptomyces sp. NPDC059994]|uniref:hypothetical protein n=1 Tax=Streptomyces sp. NPDC059994 TaxID=3347029 RepID=UPI0036C49D69